jgi:hypothetical protein
MRGHCRVNHLLKSFARKTGPMDDRPQIGPTDFEREKWEAELALRKRELVLKEQEQARVASKDFEREKWDTDTALRGRELDLKEKEHDRLVREAKTSRWWNPLVIAIIGATIAAAGSVYVSWNNGSATQQAENLKAESARILEAIKANDPDKAKQNLRFLIATGLISEPTASKILVYLDKQPPGQGPVLPSAGNVGQLFQRAFTGEQSNASPSTPTELRVFAGPNQYPPNLFKAYGILAFPAKSAPEELARHTMFCNAFASTLLDLSGLKAIPAKEEMVTIWPIDSDTDALTINDMPRDSKICDSAVQHYGSAAAQAAIADARKSHAELSGKVHFCWHGRRPNRKANRTQASWFSISPMSRL